MIVNTITCHNVYNVGAELQTYALVTYLRELGHCVQVIDYKPDYLIHYKLTGVSNPAYDKPFIRVIYQLAKLPERLLSRMGKKKKVFDDFSKKYIPLTNRRYHSNEELILSPPIADVYFAGSDQIWNSNFKNGRDPAFYLEFAPIGTVKASYAASFATDDIQEELKPQVSKWIQALDYVSVRELSGVNLAKKLGRVDTEQVLDPVFLLDDSHWISLEKEVNDSEPFVFVYDFDLNSDIEMFAKQYARRFGLKIYSIYPNHFCDRSFENEGPQVFLWLVRNAAFVISNSFHATAFSIIFEKQFVVFNRKETINTRMRDLLTLFGVDNRLVHQYDGSLGEIDYQSIRNKREKEIEISKSYIKRVLDSCSSKR